MRIAILQAAGVPGDPGANLATVRRFAREAAAGGARLLVCPEAFVTGYNIGPERVAQLAEPADGEAVRALAAVAAEAGLAVVCGYCERDGEAVYNAAVLVDRDGEVLLHYRKTHLFGELDRAAFAPGDRAPAVAELDGVGVGLLVCYDVEFPEPVRRLALEGAQLVAVPTSLMAPSHWIAELLVPARAAENQVFVAYANRVGAEGELLYVGRSCVAGPEGRVVVAGPADETLLFADVEPRVIDGARERHSYLDERRPALYGD